MAPAIAADPRGRKGRTMHNKLLLIAAVSLALFTEPSAQAQGPLRPPGAFGPGQQGRFVPQVRGGQFGGHQARAIGPNVQQFNRNYSNGYYYYSAYLAVGHGVLPQWLRRPDALARRATMRKARSKKRRPKLLAELERHYDTS